MDKTAYSSIAPANGGTKRIKGRVKEIWLAFAVMTIPMMAFTAVLLGLVFKYQITPNDFMSSDLSFDLGRAQSNNYFVRISSTTLITVASWSSSLAPILVGFALTLISYPLARGMLAASVKSDISQLPTPFQLSLIVRMITSGSFAALWSWTTYSFGWKGRREHQGRSLRSLVTILMLGLLLSVLILATDTWLHFNTKTVLFFQVHPNSDPSGLSFGVTQKCSSITTLEGCTTTTPASGTVIFESEPMRVLSNISDSKIVPVHAMDKNLFAYMASSQTDRIAPLDYVASTYALQTNCTPITSKCTDSNSAIGTGVRFKCPFQFSGMSSTAVGAYNSVTMGYFTDSTGSNNNTDKNPIGNPYYHASMIVANLRNSRPVGIENDPEIIPGVHGGSTFIGLFCSSTVYDVQYSSVNGTIKKWTMNKSNTTMTQIIQGTQRTTDVGKQNLIQAASIAGLSNNSQSIADQFALAYSQTAMAVSSGALEPRDALASQVREQILVARVPKAPLFVLVAANLTMAFLGIVLTAMALVAVRGETGEAQARLSIPALVAALFERRVKWPAEEVEEFFEERHGEKGPRIGFARAQDGGWSFQSWIPN